MTELAPLQVQEDIIPSFMSYYKWRRVEPINREDAPSARQWFSMSLYRRALYIFGGIDEKKNILNDFYQFDIVTLKWKKLTSKQGPPARHRHSAFVYKNGLYIAGGINSHNEVHDDVWHYNFDTHRWKLIKKLKLHFLCYLMGITGSRARIFGTGVYGQNNNHQLTYIYGCELSERTPKLTTVGNFESDSLREASIQRYKEDLFVLAEETLYQLNKDDQLMGHKMPVSLHGAALANIDENLLIIGGQLPNKEISKDIYVFSIPEQKFAKIEPEDGTAFPNLYNHRAISSLGSVFIFGSTADGPIHFNELFQYSDPSHALQQPVHGPTTSALSVLPDDILHHVFSFMHGEQMARSQTISKHVFQLLNRPFFKTQMKKCQFSILGVEVLRRKRFFVVLIGPSKTGKTSVVRRLVDRAYQGYVDVDLVWYQQEIKHEYGATNIDIYVPFSRQSLTATFAGLNYQEAEIGILLVVDMSDKKSLGRISATLDELAMRHQNKAPILIVANKADLESKQISTADLLTISQKYNIPFIETSAKNNVNIERAFEMITQQVYITAARKAIEQQTLKCDMVQHKRCK